MTTEERKEAHCRMMRRLERFRKDYKKATGLDLDRIDFNPEKIASITEQSAFVVYGLPTVNAIEVNYRYERRFLNGVDIELKPCVWGGK